MPIHEQLLATEEVAARLLVSEQNLRHWALKRKGPLGKRIGTHRRYRAADVDAWVRAQFADGLAARLDATRQALDGEDPEALRTAVTELLSVLDGEVPR